MAELASISEVHEYQHNSRSFSGMHFMDRTFFGIAILQNSIFQNPCYGLVSLRNVIYFDYNFSEISIF